MLKGRLGRGHYEVLVQWLNQDAASAAWVSLDEFRRSYPEFQFEDKLLLQGGERCYDREAVSKAQEERKATEAHEEKD